MKSVMGIVMLIANSDYFWLPNEPGFNEFNTKQKK